MIASGSDLLPDRVPRDLAGKAVDGSGIQVRSYAWRLILAAHGTASARLLPHAPEGVDDPGTGFVVDEDSRLVAPGQGHRTQVRLLAQGRAEVRSEASPPVLVVDPDEDAECPLTGVLGPAVIDVAPGGLLLVCSPGLVEAMDPVELIAAPRLLRQASSDEAVLLHRWLVEAERQGMPGAAVAVARYERRDGA